MPSRTPRTLAILVIFVAGPILAYKLLEPVFVYNVGWERMPDTYPAPVTVASAGWATTTKQADAWLPDALAQLETPALSAAVSVNGVQVWAGAVGYADIAAKRPADLETVFRLGSSSKAVTSIAMGTLLDANRTPSVDLNVPISTYLPEVSAPLSTITTRQAMSHTGGVRNYSLCFCFPAWEELSRTHYEGPQTEVLAHYAGDPLLFVPGESFSYTSFGYNVTGAVIEAVADMPFPDYVSQSVFQPLGLRQSHFATGTPAPPEATFYDVQDHNYKTAFRVDNTNKLPAGGILSTPTEMIRIGNEMLMPTLFREEIRDLLMTPQTLADGRQNPQNYALGWRYQSEWDVFEDLPPTAILHHHGTARGATSHFIIYPEYGIVVSVMMNLGQTSASSLGEQGIHLAELFAKEIRRRAQAE